MSSHERYRYSLAAATAFGRPVDSEPLLGNRASPHKRAGHIHLPPQSMHALFPIYTTSFVTIISTKPALSESSPINAASGKALAVWGNVCAISVFSGVVAAACCGGVSTTSVTG